MSDLMLDNAELTRLVQKLIDDGIDRDIATKGHETRIQRLECGVSNNERFMKQWM